MTFDPAKIEHKPSMTKVSVHKLEKLYSEKDGVEVKHVLTSAIPKHPSGLVVYDIYFRETPHPEFGNRYFGIVMKNDGKIYISDADSIDNIEIGMIYDSKTDQYKYSRDRHDYVSTVSGNVIDGGRAYVRGNGFEMILLKDGKFTANGENK